MRRHVRLSIRIGILALLTVGAFAAVVSIAGHLGRLARFNLLEGLGIVRTTDTQTATVMLERMRDLYRLDTIEMVYKTVFPYDYLDPALDIRSIIAATRATNGSVADILSPAQELYLRAYNLSHELGMQTGPDHYDFVVVTAVVRAGLDLSAAAVEQRGS